MVSEPIYGHLMDVTGTGLLSLNGHKSARKPKRKEETHNLSKVSRFLFNSFYIRRVQKQLFFLPYKSLYFERYATVPMATSFELRPPVFRNSTH